MHDHDDDDDLPPERSFHSTSFMTGILVGAAVGAGLALLFAPASGEHTRKIIRKKARVLGRDASHGLVSAKDELRRTLRDKKEALRDKLAQGLEAVEDELGV